MKKFNYFSITFYFFIFILNSCSNFKDKDEKKDEQSENKIELDSSSSESQQAVAFEENDEIGEDSNESDFENLPEIANLKNIGDYKIFAKKFFLSYFKGL